MISRNEAANIVLSEIIGSNTHLKGVFVLPELIEKNDSVFVANEENELFAVDFDSWFFFIDNWYLILNWPHPSQYVFVNAQDGRYEIFSNSYFPRRFSEMDTVFVWGRPQSNLLPTLSFEDSSGHGCGNFFVYNINDADIEAIVVKADTQKLALSSKIKTFNLEDEPESLEVFVDFYDSLPEGNEFIWGLYCNDVGYNNKEPKKWIGKKGQVGVSIHDLQPGGGYKTTIILQDIHFFDENGENEIVLDHLTLSDVFVGWFPG